MGEDRIERRLTAILAADAAGYSRLIAEDEEGTLRRFRAHLDEAIAPRIADRSGRIVKTMGDGVLAAFSSTVEALRAAVAIQRAMAQRNAAAPADHRMAFRIGVHAGDVVIEDGDIFGDGVNVAARLQTAADAGGIAVSARVQEDADGRIEAAFEDMGGLHFKNMERPVRTYRVVLDGPSAAAAPAPRGSERASIAVLPFQNISGDASQDYFAEALTEDIVAALSRWRWFFVIDRNSSAAYGGRKADARNVGRDLGVRFALQGSVRRAGARIRVSAQLVDTANASALWSETFDRDDADIFALQDDITARVVAAIEPAMAQSEGARVAARNIRDWTAIDLFQRGMWLFNRMTKDGYAEALVRFSEAIERDNALAIAHSALARTYYAGVIYGWSPQPRADLTAGRESAQTAVKLDPRDAIGHFSLSGTALYLSRHREALAAAQTALELNPNFAFGHFRLGQVLVYMGRAADAIVPIRKSMLHSPFDPQIGAMTGLLALAQYHSGDYAAAADSSEAALSLNNARAGVVLAASLARLGRKADIPASALPAARRRQGSAMPLLAPYARPQDFEDLAEGLRLAESEPAP